MLRLRSFVSTVVRAPARLKSVKRCLSSKLKSSFMIISKNFKICYDGRLKQPRWVFEILTEKSIKSNVNREKYYFRIDKRLAPSVRSTLKDYRLSGLDKGHMAPAANHRVSNETISSTFHLSNCSPQIPVSNRIYWLSLEKYVRELVKTHKKINVVTGPLFIPKEVEGKKVVSYEVIGESEVAVPTHHFKVIHAKRFEESYIVPNKELDQEFELSSFKTKREKVEKLSGIVFDFKTQGKGSDSRR